MVGSAAVVAVLISVISLIELMFPDALYCTIHPGNRVIRVIN